jgi:tripartite ATP-independent transporter DctM subunit
MGVSVGDLFLGALIPGLALALLYGLYTMVLAIVSPNALPALPPSERELASGVLLRRVAFALAPPLVLILLVLGSIFAGIATPTEAGALGAGGATALAAASRRLTIRALRETAEGTARLTAMVMMLLIGATAFSLVFRGLEGDLWLEDLFLDLPGGKFGFVLVVNLLVFVLGFFIDFFEIAFVVLPLVLPVARALGIDLVWFGVLLGMNLQASFLTPPFGFALFYLRGVAPKEVTTVTIYRGVVPFIVLQVIALAAVWAYPELVTGLLR